MFSRLSVENELSGQCMMLDKSPHHEYQSYIYRTVLVPNYFHVITAAGVRGVTSEDVREFM